MLLVALNPPVLCEVTGMLKKLIVLNKSDFWLLWGIVGGAFVLMQLIEGGILAATRADSAILLSGAVLPCAAGGIVIFTTMAQIMVTFEQGLQFGCTRKRALWLSLGLSAAEAAGAMGLAAVLTLLERLSCPRLWQALTGMQSFYFAQKGRRIPEYMAGMARMETSLHIVNFTFAWYWWAAIALGAAALGIIMGALIQRFGRKGMWVLWGIWMAACFAPQLLPWKHYTITDWLFPLLGAAAVLALVWSVWSLLHAVVKH